MNGCSEWADAILDCALGQSPAPALAAHLAICPRCRKGLEQGRENAARIDRALRRAVAVEPPVYGPERALARIRERGRTDVRTGWKWVSASAVLALVIAIAMWTGRPAPRPAVAALSTWRSPTQALLRPPVAAAWNTKPRLGEGFFKIKTSGEIHAQ